MRVLAISIFMAAFMFGCSSSSTSEKSITTEVTGEMLFSGPNSLQAPVSVSVDGLAEELNLEPSDLKRIGISGIRVTLDGEQAELSESLLLQIVSNNTEMEALGTLSPLGEGNSFDLNVAEEVNLLPFLKDDGATWVLDVNLSEDIMDEMKATAELSLTIKHKN